ncbi:YicC/YloC family endoribonuclease [Eubacterium pyruvativorans]|uniref:YicC/YloC family endoribonuclease n=1 Tax=Eubacterium pyruvativorans TaxID=155865 RepID=UPI0013D7B59B|nr:YicC/YloC family endoribonuclease [Eubacterium pyruvativorans]MCI5747238.1 YicC family protein [Eubacterium pyruvativorans]MDD7685267.1 YicC family protein [Eubacterium pyruvativorans]
MIRSMTGFGRGEYSDGKRNVIIEVKSVNHRYCDINVKMPRRYLFAEEAMKKALKKYVRRGKVDCSVTVESLTESDVKIRLNRPAAAQYIENLKALKDEFGVSGEVTLDLLAGFPDVMQQVPEVEDEEAITRALVNAADEAGRHLEEMRGVEGGKLAKDLLARGELVKDLVARIEKRSDSVPKEYRERLTERIRDLMENSEIEVPEDRVAVEVAFFADKCNITEELTRLKSHMDQMKAIIESGTEAEGKKLDFLVQEMNREANTIGSKANDLTITELMLRVKAEVEKIREQVQNIE